jgi:DNA-binding response OmpR family regulator
MPAQRTLLVLADLSKAELTSVKEEAEVAEFTLQRAANLQAAVVALATKPPAAVMMDVTHPDAEALCYKVRGKRRSSDIAVFGLGRRLTDTVFTNAFRWGADDVIARHAEGALSARLVALPADQSVQPQVRGDAIVADADTTRANLIGRTLSNAGYEVRYLSDKASLRQLASDEHLRLVVASSDLGFARTLITEARDKGSVATWIVTCHPGDQEGLKNSLNDIDRVGVVSVFDPVNDILYVSNDLGGDYASSARQEERHAYGTMVAFRAAGREADEFGYTYNVSAHGMYVRTLAPPVDEQVWLELRPPAAQRRVRLVGEIRWRRNFGRLGTATAPPGFGLRIVDALAADQELWMRGVATLGKETQALKPASSPKAAPGHIDPPPAPSRPRASRDPSAPDVTDLVVDAEDEDDRQSAVAVAIADAMGTVGRTAASAARDAGLVEPTPVKTVDGPRPGPAGLGKTLPLGDYEAPQPASASGPPRPGRPTPANAMELVDAALGAPAPPAGDQGTAATRPPATPPPLPGADRAVLPIPAGDALHDPVRLSEPQYPSAPEISYHSVPEIDPAFLEPDDAPATPMHQFPTAAVAAVAAVIGLGVVGGGGYWAYSNFLASPDSPQAEPLASTQPATASSSPPKPTRTPAPKASSASPVGSAPPTAQLAAPTAAASEAPAPGASVPTSGIDPAEGGDGSDLQWNQGYLVVNASTSVDVYATGVYAGKTNQKNIVKCGLRWVRLGTQPGPVWVSEGRTVNVKCQSVTLVNLEPNTPVRP